MVDSEAAQPIQEERMGEDGTKSPAHRRGERADVRGCVRGDERGVLSASRGSARQKGEGESGGGRDRGRGRCVKKDNRETGRCSLCLVRCDMSNWSGGGEITTWGHRSNTGRDEKVRYNRRAEKLLNMLRVRGLNFLVNDVTMTETDENRTCVRTKKSASE